MILVFTRAPVPGQAKTRLIPSLGETGAAHLHAGLLERTLATASQVSADLQLWCSPDTSHPVLGHCSSAFGVSLHEQCAGDLGRRMAVALEQALETYGRAILVGTDCPDLSAAAMTTALYRLQAGDDWVIGPARDGGYYLIGTSMMTRAAFAGVDWGSDRVYRQTRERLEGLGLSWSALATRQDMDTPEDLLSFADHLSVIERGKHIVELAG